jgi:outer membrane protein
MFRHVAAAAVVAATTLTALPAAATTIGYVDTAKVLLSYSGAKNAQGQMAQELQAYQKAFLDRQKKIAEAQKAGKPQAEIQKMTEAFEKELAPLKSRAMSLEQRLSGDVKTKIEAKINAIAKAKKLDYVLDKAAMLYGGVDITNDVINSLR